MDLNIGSIHVFASIDWRVLEVKDGQALLISEKILEMQAYNVEYVDITWKRCTLREYLNGEFYNSLGQDRHRIADSNNDNPNNPWYGTAGGSTTVDKVFLLSLDEVCRHLGDGASTGNLSRKGSTGNNYYITDKNNAARVSKYGNVAYWWWLRSPGYYGDNAAIVYDDGRVFVGGLLVNNDYGGVRPALRLNL